MTNIQAVRRDGNSYKDNKSYFGPNAFAFIAVVILAFSVVGTLLYLRRCRRRALKQLLPQYTQHGHHRSLTITTVPSRTGGQSIFVYDEKMNLIANSSSPPTSSVPEIRVTFPDEEGQGNETSAGRVVVLKIADSGSVGMEPLHRDALPPYQRADAERLHSLDLERMGGLKEKPESQLRYL